MFNTYFESTRQKLLAGFSITEIIEVREKVFEDAEVGDSILFFAENSNNAKENVLKYFKVNNIYPEFLLQASYTQSQENLLSKQGSKFFITGIQLNIETEPLSSFCHVYNGLKPRQCQTHSIIR